MKMKNPLENLFKKVQKQGKDAIVTGAAFLTMGGSAMAADQPNQKIEDGTPQKTESVAQVKTQDQETAQVENYEAGQQRMEAIRKLEKEKMSTELEVQKLEDGVEMLQAEFRKDFQNAISYSGVSTKGGLGDIEVKIANLAKKMAEEKVAQYDIERPEALNGLLGILLSGNGPLGKESEYLAKILNERLGSTVMMATQKPGVYKSPDMVIHENLSKIPRKIVEDVLKTVKTQHKLDKINAELETLRGAADVSGTI